MQITIKSQFEGDIAVLELTGDVDVYTSAELRNHFVKLIRDEHRKIVIDTDAVQFMDSTGLGVLVGALKRVRAVDGSLGLVCVEDRLLKLFRITGLDKVLSLHDSRASALAAAQLAR